MKAIVGAFNQEKALVGAFAKVRFQLYTAHIPHIGLINTLAASSNFSCQNPGAKVKGEAKKIKILISGRKSAGRFSKNENKLVKRSY